MRRFGALPEWGEKQLASATQDGLDAITDAVFDSETLEQALNAGLRVGGK